ncbi:MAG TPA: ABC transporter permease [Syntrophorhabdales bacterium]|nr:ABC transporter permease [Syntrophorhabdales bacterium]
MSIREPQREESVRAPGPKSREAISVTAIRPSKGFSSLGLRDLWEYRELAYFLVWRDIKVRYKQTAIGAAWVILQPLLTMLIFTLIFGILVRVPSEGLPYSVFVYTALVPWSYFSEAVSRGGLSLVANTNLISKVYFPRLVIPISSVVTPVIDFVLSFFILLGLIAWFNIKPTWAIATLPVFLLLTIVTAFAVSIWFSAVNVKYRDVGYTIPFLIQFWMFASPIVYPISIIPARWRPIYSLNPLVGVVEGFRWALLGKESPNFWAMGISVAGVLILLAGGILYFRRMERTFADVI